MDDLSAQHLIQQAQAQGISSWSEEKKKDFVNVFKQRALCAQYILLETANRILSKARNRRFISGKHLAALEEVHADHLVERDYNHNTRTVGGWNTSDLNKLAEERADAVLDELPPLRRAVQVISTDIAKKIDEREEVLKKAKDLKAKLEDLGGAFSMAEVDQRMTVGAFREMIKDRERKRKALADTLARVGDKGCELDMIINKALYEGLPGLSDAVIKVAKTYVDRARSLDAVTRRVEERVLFGDSEAAVTLLKGFERDELEVEQSVREEFQAALLKLNIAGKKLKAKEKK